MGGRAVLRQGVGTPARAGERAGQASCEVVCDVLSGLGDKAITQGIPRDLADEIAALDIALSYLRAYDAPCTCAA